MPELATRFNTGETLSEAWFARLTDLRIQHPGHVVEIARERRRRDTLTLDGRLNIIACDHPARRVTHIGEETLKMADRRDYLARMLRILIQDAADGVMASMDILEELLLLQEISGKRFLDGKVLIVSLNRGGLAGVKWEMDDPVTGPTPETCAAWNLDGAKMLWRLCDDDASSLKTMQACTDTITRLNALALPMFLEPLPVHHTAAGYKVVKQAEALARIVGVASALGDSSRNLWLKLPYCENFELAARATSLPIVLLGGEASGDPADTLRWIREAMSSAHNVRGVMLGRNLLYPGEEDPLATARRVHELVHAG